MELLQLLHSTFGFSTFRANQEAVCRAATDGRDVLLVMPTGAGKSLCYQLPALARQQAGHASAALVISPLIALMDDQAHKLTAAGLRVARIHSGLSRDDARQACRDYLDGKLNFLFIAPERMRVPGFPEMLARRKPSLIAIDEAHCISAWGHDFRPDYRTLGEHLPALRPAPIIALTATATPQVQKDIATQLNLQQPALFIHGFRRDNLAIEILELSRPQRTPFIRKFLTEASAAPRLPAIVYAPSRKAAEELAAELGKSAAAYHAGLDPATRERVQRHFLAGQLQIVVATIAFGMGIDKADVRTVIHAALPASVEAYYQEIGRAGRDGLPSRTVLLYSFQDRKMHDFFLDRDYPPATELQRVFAALTPDYAPPEILARTLRMDRDTFARAVEKLAAQGAAQTDMAGNVRAAAVRTPWQTGYVDQIAFRRAQIDRIMDFAQTPQCRMTALIRHFGDLADSHKPCGHCDVCAPSATTAQTFAEPTAAEDRDLRAILRALDGGNARATGRLHTELDLSAAVKKDRKLFDALLDGLARAGLLQFTNDTFTAPDGRVITYKKASLTHDGQTLPPSAPLGVLLPASSFEEGGGPASSSAARKSRDTRKRQFESESPLTPAQKSVEESLRAWRKAEAAKTGKPAFIVLTDACLRALAQHQPHTLTQLQQVPGIGPDKAERYGPTLLTLCSTGNVPRDDAPTGTGPRRVTAQPTSLVTPAPDSSVAHSSAASSRMSGTSASRPATLPQAQISNPVPAPAPPLTSFREAGGPASATSRPFPGETLTPTQLALEQRLREWRKSESEKMGLPQFFVLGTTALRSIVLTQPRTLPELQSIHGIGTDKIDRFGPSILALCNP